MKVRGYTIRARVNLFEADLAGVDLSIVDLTDSDLRKADFRSANLYGVRFGDADLREANFQGANLDSVFCRYADFRGANLAGANLWGADVRHTNLQLAQVLCPTPDLSGLARHLAAHVTSGNFDQEDWGHNECGTPCCLAGAAAEYIGLSGNSGAGVLAIKEVLPDFDLDVLYQSDALPALDELTRFVAIDLDEIPVD